MALASLTVDLTLGLARFESDSGKAAQIVTRDSEKMSRAALTYARALERQSDQATKTAAEFQTLKAASLGLGDDILAKIPTGGAFTSIGTQGAAAFKAVGAAAAAAGVETDNLLSIAVAKIREVNQQAAALKAQAVGQNDAKTLTDDGLKVRLQQINEVAAATRAEISAEFTRDKAAQQAAAAEIAAGAARQAQAQRIVDAQNGLTATYRTQLAALRELRDAGNLSPAQFRQAGADLVARQPVVQQRGAEAGAAQAIADAEIESTNKRIAAFERLKDAVARLNFQKQAAGNAADKATADAEIEATQRRIAAFDRLRDSVAKLNFGQQTKDAAAIKATADADSAAADQRRAAALRVIDAQNGLSASYRQQLQVLRELRDTGALTPQQFKVAGTALVAKQPAVQQREAATQAAQVVADAEVEATNKRTAAFERLKDTVSKLNFQKEIADTAASKAEAEAEAAATDKRAAAFERLRESVAKINYTEQAKGDAAVIADIDAEIAAQQRKLDAYQKTTAEILAQRAAERGLVPTAATSTIGVAGGGIADESGPIAQRIASLRALTQANLEEAASASRRREADSFAAQVNSRAAAIGTGVDGRPALKLQSELLAERAAVLGLTKDLNPAISKIAEFEKATGNAGKGAFATTNQLQTLKYTLSDIVASAGSGISPLTILLQQGPQLAQVEGGLTGIGRTVLSLVTPFRLLAVAGVAAIGAIGYAWYEGAQQSRAFNDAIVLSGTYAGVTEGQFNSLAKSIAASGQVTISSAREYTQALIATGEVGPKNLAAAAEAAARYGEATGKSAKDVATEFGALNKDVYAGATKLNQSLNFLSTAQLQHIRNLQDQGKNVEAAGVVYDALNDRLHKLEPNLGTLDRVLRSVSTSWKEFWDRAYDIGRTQTIEDKIRDARALAAAGSGVGGERVSQTQLDPQRRAQLAASQVQGTSQSDVAGENLRLLLRSQTAGEQTTADKAATAELDKKATAASDYYRAAEKGAKAASGAVRELAEEQRHYAELVERKKTDPTVELPTKATRDAIQKRIRESYTDKPAVSESDAQRKALLDQDLKYLKDQLEQQKDTLQFGQQVIAQVYAAGNVSLKDYYDAKRQLIADGTQKELNALTDEQARLEVELERGAFKDPHEKIQLQTQLNESVAKSAKVRIEAARAATLANGEESNSLKALTDRVVEFQAQALQQGGDDKGAALLRTQQQIAAAAQLAKASKGTAFEISDETLARGTQALQIQNDLAEVQRKVGLASADAARAEETYLLLSSQGGVSLAQQDSAIYEIRAKQVEQLGELARKAKELADASTDPRVKAAAADLALTYAKALDNIDPALQRLRADAASLAQSLASSIASSSSGFGDAYSARRKDNAERVATEQDAIDKKIDKLQTDLSQAQDQSDKRRLRARINQLEADKASVKGDSAATALLKTFERDVLGPLAKQAAASVSKILIEEPLKKSIEDSLRSVTEGDNFVGNFLKKVLGTGGTGKAPEVEAAKAAATALEALQRAADAAALSLGGPGAKPAAPVNDLLGVKTGTATDGIAPGDTGGENYGNEAKRAASDLAVSLNTTRASASEFGSILPSVTQALSGLGPAGSLAARALALIANSSAVQSAAKGAGDWFSGLFGSAASSGGSANSGGSYTSAQFSHTGGVIGGTGGWRASVPTAVFAGAARYHDGGAVAAAPAAVVAAAAPSAAVPGLKANEVPAILMGGPRGTREEVLHASDPRHADNISPQVLAYLNGLRHAAPAQRASAVATALFNRSTVRYHDGGVVSMGRPAVVQRPSAPWMSGGGGGSAQSSRPPMSVTIVQQFAPGTTRATTDQAALAGAREAMRAGNRGGA